MLGEVERARQELVEARAETERQGRDLEKLRERAAAEETALREERRRLAARLQAELDEFRRTTQKKLRGELEKMERALYAEDSKFAASFRGSDVRRRKRRRLGVAVVGSLFSSLYAASLVDSLDGRVPADQLARAEESVGYADGLAAAVPGVRQALETAFMSGFNTACLVIGLLCLAGAAFSWFALPGDRYDPLAEGGPAAATAGVNAR